MELRDQIKQLQNAPKRGDRILLYGEKEVVVTRSEVRCGGVFPNGVWAKVDGKAVPVAIGINLQWTEA